MSLHTLSWSEMCLAWDECLAEISKAAYFEMVLAAVESGRSK
jgi:hypothetical protein